MAEVEKKNLPIAEEPEFITEIPAINPDDPVHFAQMNKILASLLGNDVFLDRLADKMIEKNLIAHVLDCENPQMVLGADQGPAITGLIDEVKGDVTQLYSEILRSVRYNPDSDYIQVYANGVWNNVVLAKLKFNGIFFANGAYNVPYLMGFDYAGIYYQNPDCASMSMGIGFSGDGKIQITHTVHNKTSGTPSQSSGGKYISKNKVNLKGYTNLQVIGYCTAQETGIQNGFYFNIYDQDTNTLLIETLMPTGSNGTVNINIAGIQREVYFGGVIWKYCWGVGASAQNIGYIQSIIAS